MTRKTQSPSRQITLGGNSYTLQMGFRATAAMEDHYDAPIAEIGKKFEPNPETGLPTFRVKDAQVLLWAALLKHHPDLTQDDVLDLLEAELDERGSLDEVMTETFTAWGAGVPTPQEVGEEAAENPKSPAEVPSE